MACLGGERRGRRGPRHCRACRQGRRWWEWEWVLGRNLVRRQAGHVDGVPDVSPASYGARPPCWPHGGQDIRNAGQGCPLCVLVLFGNGLVLDIQLEQMVAFFGGNLSLRL